MTITIVFTTAEVQTLFTALDDKLGNTAKDDPLFKKLTLALQAVENGIFVGANKIRNITVESDEQRSGMTVHIN